MDWIGLDGIAQKKIFRLYVIGNIVAAREFHSWAIRILNDVEMNTTSEKNIDQVGMI